MGSNQYVITKDGFFAGKGYTRDRMYKFNIKNNKTSTSSINMFSSINFWHARLCRINSRYVRIRSSLLLIPRLFKILKNVNF